MARLPSQGTTSRSAAHPFAATVQVSGQNVGAKVGALEDCEGREGGTLAVLTAEPCVPESGRGSSRVSPGGRLVDGPDFSVVTAQTWASLLIAL